eukprot:gnl/TRDRNA2_/TRDRNA2_159390_c0_seq1.p1 gnl/TRDRNA2_/TRDRNA2_159390_c0~~gnl/TRDRNA2_/TRDRNA2_159390_c0_seq1.p1  ORF type:complete len:157 (+),score=33.10 gnl/TRDRNA2_/TRDRNA2_159390_c0_seq1:2-472(+)
MIQAQLAAKDSYVKKLSDLFKEIDFEHSGEITLAQFEHMLQVPQVTAYFASLGLEASDAWTLFKLLATQQKDAVELGDFVDGCMRLKGTARSIDVGKLMYENQWIMQTLVELHAVVRCIKNSLHDDSNLVSPRHYHARSTKHSERHLTKHPVKHSR